MRGMIRTLAVLGVVAGAVLWPSVGEAGTAPVAQGPSSTTPVDQGGEAPPDAQGGAPRGGRTLTVSFDTVGLPINVERVFTVQIACNAPGGGGQSTYTLYFEFGSDTQTQYIPSSESECTITEPDSGGAQIIFAGVTIHEQCSYTVNEDSIEVSFGNLNVCGASLVNTYPPTLIVQKVVTGEAPDGTTFGIELYCTTQGSGQSPQTLTFPAVGGTQQVLASPQGPNDDLQTVCTVEEDDRAGATGVDFAAASDSNSVRCSYQDYGELLAVFIQGYAYCGAVVTNTFAPSSEPPPPTPPPPPPPAAGPASALAVTPTFTG